jgi:flagellin FlaB
MLQRKDVRQLLSREQGITGLETAIILIAFVVVAAVFAFVVLSTGLFSAERSKETVLAGLSKTRGSMGLSGSVIATSNGTEITTIAFDVTLAAGGSSVNWDPAATNNKTSVSFSDTSVSVDSMTYTTTVITGDADNLLEPGELFKITLTGVDAVAGIDLNVNDTFRLTVQPASGAYLVIQRTLPGSIAETVVKLD